MLGKQGQPCWIFIHRRTSVCTLSCERSLALVPAA